MARKATLPAGELNLLESRFVEHYVSTGNGSQAYIAAGYSRNGADANACRLLKRAEIKEAIRLEREKLQTILNFKREDHIKILHGIATARIDDFNGIDMDNPDSMRKIGHKMHAIESFEHTKTGIRIKLRDPKAWIDELTQILGHGKASDDRIPTESTATRVLRFIRERRK